MTHPRPVPGAPISGPSFSQSVNGTCPTCGAQVFWVRDHTNGADGAGWFAPLEPTVVQSWDPDGWDLELDLVYVAVSTSGAAAAITPERHRRHRCPAEAVQAVLARVGSMGFYTAVVLAIPCPVSVCGAAPGMLCVNSRRVALPRPHGARRVVAEGGPLD